MTNSITRSVSISRSPWKAGEGRQEREGIVHTLQETKYSTSNAHICTYMYMHTHTHTHTHTHPAIRAICRQPDDNQSICKRANCDLLDLLEGNVLLLLKGVSLKEVAALHIGEEYVDMCRR